jgi:phosphomannomutase
MSATYMLEREIVMGGEESGGIGFQRHLPERDGLLNACCWPTSWPRKARRWASSSPISRPSTASTSTAASTSTSPTTSRTRHRPRPRAQPGDPVFAGMPILRQENLDGVKFYLDNPEAIASTKPNAAETWLLLRASGTEPLMRIYTESCSKNPSPSSSNPPAPSPFPSIATC